MNTERCLRVATRIDALLTDTIGEGIELRRLVDDALYARDVLLVCDALDDPMGPKLARAFRIWAAAAAPVTRAPRRHAANGRRAVRVEPPLQAPVDTDAGVTTAARTADDDDTGTGPHRAPLVEAARRWLSPQRWLPGR